MAESRVVRTVALVGPAGPARVALLGALSGRKPEWSSDPTTHLVTVEAGDRTFHLLDCPGVPALLAEVGRNLAVADGAILVLSASEPVAHLERLQDLLAASGKPVLAAVIGGDGADPAQTLTALASVAAAPPVQVALPLGADTALTEVVAEGDDELLARYLDNGGLTSGQLSTGLSRASAAGRLLPVVTLAALDRAERDRLLDFATIFFPDPRTTPIVTAGGAFAPEANGPVLIQAFRTAIDNYLGRSNWVRVRSGTLRRESSLVNARTGSPERVAHLLRTDGSRTWEIESAGPGEVVVLGKLKDVRAGDALCDPHQVVSLAGLEPAARPVARAIRFDGPEEKIAAGLRKLLDEDPGLGFYHSAETGEMLLWGTSEAHLDLTAERARSRHGLPLELAVPTPAYRETIAGAAKAHGRYKRQTGGHGQFGDCHLEVEPLPRGGGFAFEDAIVGGAVPRQFIPSVEKGARGATAHGPLAGYPVVDVKVRLVFGTHHPVDSSDLAFQIAGSLAMKQALAEAQPMLIEPIVKLEVVVPEAAVGPVLADLGSRRARVQGLEPAPRGVRVKAHCPHAEVMTYDADLLSMTQGAGSFTIEHSHYEPVPPYLAAKIVEQRQQREGTHAESRP
jgi:elongation factor G